MGASTVVTQVILFIAVLGIASSMIVAIKHYTDETEAVFNEKSDKHNQMLQTSINIDVIRYNNATNLTYIYVKNIGSTSMDTDKIDVYIDGTRMPKDGNLSVGVVSDTEITNTGKWDPKELLLIVANKSLDKDISHDVIVVTPYSIQDTDTFSI